MGRPATATPLSALRTAAMTRSMTQTGQQCSARAEPHECAASELRRWPPGARPLSLHAWSSWCRHAPPRSWRTQLRTPWQPRRRAALTHGQHRAGLQRHWRAPMPPRERRRSSPATPRLRRARSMCRRARPGTCLKCCQLTARLAHAFSRLPPLSGCRSGNRAPFKACGGRLPRRWCGQGAPRRRTGGAGGARRRAARSCRRCRVRVRGRIRARRRCIQRRRRGRAERVRRRQLGGPARDDARAEPGLRRRAGRAGAAGAAPGTGAGVRSARAL